MNHPIRFFSLFSLVCAAAGGFALRHYLPQVGPVFAWLITLTVVTFFTYGYDKAVAGSRYSRVPEKVLLLLVFLGGTLGAVLGMGLFRHKTIKGSFRIKFWLVSAVQVILLATYFYFIYPELFKFD
ncbi:MAG: DUF1294 domain-containing protein [Planctomycetes bacterium]|nr:DUF1294 domain-containing protein [Planctomycetota bacterium]